MCHKLSIIKITASKPKALFQIILSIMKEKIHLENYTKITSSIKPKPTFSKNRNENIPTLLIPPRPNNSHTK